MRIIKSDLETIQNAFGSAEGLRGVVQRLIQEVEVLKQLLKERGLWDEANYKRLMVGMMIHDHNSTGPAPQTSHSYFPYALHQSSFMKYRFDASDEEVGAFEREVHRVSSFT